MAEVVIDRVTKRFGEVEATSDVSLAIPNGELVEIGRASCRERV